MEQGQGYNTELCLCLLVWEKEWGADSVPHHVSRKHQMQPFEKSIQSPKAGLCLAPNTRTFPVATSVSGSLNVLQIIPHIKELFCRITALMLTIADKHKKLKWEFNLILTNVEWQHYEWRNNRAIWPGHYIVAFSVWTSLCHVTSTMYVTELSRQVKTW